MSSVCPGCREKLQKEFENMPALKLLPESEREAVMNLIIEAVEAAHTKSTPHELV